MNKAATTISQGCLQDLYLQRAPPKSMIILQILAFQISQYNPKQIILRISDKQAFMDCLLVGPYAIVNSKIVSTEYSHSSQSFKPLDMIRVSDYFCKIDQTKICNLKIIIRKIEEQQPLGHILGRPEEISQFIQNNQAKSNKYPVFNQNLLINSGTVDVPIKIQENAEFTYEVAPGQRNQVSGNTSINNYQNIPKSNSKQEETLNLQDIMDNKPGFFIGRLVRSKFGVKQAKDGPMSFLYLGFLDSNGDIVRVHLAGRIAIRESRQLKKGKVYYIKGLELFQGDKQKGGPQIRLKEKQHRIQQIQNQIIRSQYKQSYYRWQHEHEWVESQMVDVIGIVEDIEEKITYKNANTFQEQRDVVRLIIRNAFKTVKISFWADNISVLTNLNLKKKQAIIIEDIKKKKTIFLDYIPQSNIIVLDQQSELKEQLSMFLPPAQEAPEPTNIKQLLDVYQCEPFSAKIRTLNLFIANINIKWITYKICNQCKKKVEKILEICPECSHHTFSFRYNCPVQFSDWTGSINCVGFDSICQKLFGLTANDFNKLPESEIKQMIEMLLFQEYHMSIQNKNSRLIIRVMQKISNSQLVQSTLQNISVIREQTQIYH